MKQIFKYVLVGIVCSILTYLIIRFYVYDKVDHSLNDKELVQQIDSLSKECFILKCRNDSLICKIDTSKQKVTEIIKWYEKKVNVIRNESTSDDVIFFTEYLSENYK